MLTTPFFNATFLGNTHGFVFGYISAKYYNIKLWLYLPSDLCPYKSTNSNIRHVQKPFRSCQIAFR